MHTIVLGLHLGPAAGPSALAGVEVVQSPRAGGEPRPHVTALVAHYHVRLLKRWLHGTSYVAIAKDVTALLARPPFPGAPLVLDATEVGRAVVDLFRQTSLRPNLVPITLTAGHRALFTKGAWHVCKKDLAGALQAALGQGRLKVADLPEREQLFRELRTFRIKVSQTAGNVSFEALRERDHDDLVLAVALPVWLNELTCPVKPTLRIYRFRERNPRGGPRSRSFVCSPEEVARDNVAAGEC
jgi:hypothetical protein